MVAFPTKYGVLAAGLCLTLVTYAIAQQSQTRDNASDRGNASQVDRSDSQQSGQSATQQNGRRSQQAGQSQRSQSSQFSQRTTLARAGGSSQEVEQYLANCLMSKNQSEIELNQFAEQQSQNPQVKQFAQQMIQDHQKLAQQLQQLAGNQAASRGSESTSLEATSQRDLQRDASDTTQLPGSSGAGQTIRGTAADTQSATDTSSQGTRTSQSLTATTGGSNAAIQQLMQIERQVVERKGQMVKDELQQKQGAEFDKCYLTTVAHAHVGMLAELETIEQQGQGQLSQVAQQARPIVQQHLDHAKQLIMQQEQGAQPGGAQAERQQRTRTQR